MHASRAICRVSIFGASVCFFAAAAAVGQDFRIVRIASGLNQPTYLTQAPGDPANILYYTERTTNSAAGFGAVNLMGRVWRYDVDTGQKTLVLDLSNRSVTNDDGLQTIAFNPDFNVLGSAGYGRMYVSSSAYNGSGTVPTNRVEEYSVYVPSPSASTTSLQRTILQYNNNVQNNHTIDWIGFDPTATGAARDYLYISTGDASFGNNYNGGVSPTGRPAQNPADVRGKILRVDVDPTHADAYPSDANRNFAIPTTNPIPVYNAAHPTTPLMGANSNGSTPAFGEVYLTGIRNGYRVSFDTATGDMYWGDVGENAVEEVDTLKAGANVNGPPVDFGWPIHEGTDPSGVPNPTVPGGPTHSTTTNPFTGVTSQKPIQQFPHVNGTGGSAAIGGYVYHGPIASLQGKYFYADFVETNDVYNNFNPRVPQLFQLSFDRNTPTSSFNGANGTVTDISTFWNSLVVDPKNPNYKPSIGGLWGLDHIVSFGQDNSGNMYLVDFGNLSAGQSTFDGEYPAAGLGEIFKLVPLVKGDFNLDGKLTTADVQAMLAALTDINQYETNSQLSAAQFNFLADFDGSGTVNNADIQSLLNTLKMQAVPEPAAIWLWACGVIAVVFLARRKPS
jgi:glucose/arabinose dehydrogenase